jgi:hypothetical protein
MKIKNTIQKTSHKYHFGVKFLILIIFSFFYTFLASSQVYFEIETPDTLKGFYQIGIGDSTRGWGNGDLSKKSIKGELKLAESIDSLAGNVLLGNYTGKIIMIYRGTFTFVQKAINAQNSGAIGVIILNHGKGNNGIDSNNVFDISSADSNSLKVKIPVIMISLKDRDKIVSEFKKGKTIIGQIGKPSCINPIAEITPTENPIFCKGGSVVLKTIKKINYSYQWLNNGGTIDGATEPTYIATNSGNYSVLVSDKVCHTESSKLKVGDTIIPTPQLCMITSENNKNLILWMNEENNYLDKYKIYKQSHINSSYELVQEQSKQENSQWLDSSDNNSIERYKISSLDICNQETQLSLNHTTILLTSNIGTNGTINLLWNPYEGFEYENFEILRSIDNINFNIISNVANNTYAYVDKNPPSSNVFYQIRIQNPNSCSSKKRDLNYVISNTVDKNGNSLLTTNERNKLQSKIRIYPNPSYNKFIIENLNPNTLITITDSKGLKILEKHTLNSEIEIQLKDYAEKGIYFIQGIYNGEMIISSKIVLE